MNCLRRLGLTYTRYLALNAGQLRQPQIPVLSASRCYCERITTGDTEPPIPEYQDRGPDESERDKRARLLYQSRKRGMSENGLLLSTFAHKYLDGLTTEQLCQYDSIINKPTNDWEIYYWMTGHKPTPEKYDNEVMDMLKHHATNEDRDVRIRQPDLK